MAKEQSSVGKEAQPMGATEAAVEGIKAIVPGLSMSKILHDIGEEAGHQVSQGAHELAAALFSGSSFVMYPRQGHDDQQQGLPEHQNEMGGRER